jgi:hypothetical protein
MKAMERARFVKIMRSQARELRKDISEWREDFEVDSVAFTLEWAAQMLVKYGPDVLPEFKPPVRRVRK